MPPNLASIVVAPDLAQSFQILRSTGSWNLGTWQSAMVTIQALGVISVASPEDLQMSPEGDVIKSAMVFHTDQPLFTTNANDSGQGGSSDLLVWRGQQFRILSIAPYADYGYYKAIATRLTAAGGQV